MFAAAISLKSHIKATSTVLKGNVHSSYPTQPTESSQKPTSALTPRSCHALTPPKRCAGPLRRDPGSDDPSGPECEDAPQRHLSARGQYIGRNGSGAAGVRALLKQAQGIKEKGSLAKAVERFLRRQVELEDASPFDAAPAARAEHAARMSEAQGSAGATFATLLTAARRVHRARGRSGTVTGSAGVYYRRTAGLPHTWPAFRSVCDSHWTFSGRHWLAVESRSIQAL
jgi:hypothetical protein